MCVNVLLRIYPLPPPSSSFLMQSAGAKPLDRRISVMSWVSVRKKNVQLWEYAAQIAHKTH